MSSEASPPTQPSLTRRLVTLGAKLAVSIGGDVVRIADTAKVARSKTLATTVILADRTMGMMGLVLIAATGVTLVTYGGHAQLPVWPSMLWAGFTSGMLVGGFMLWSPSG